MTELVMVSFLTEGNGLFSASVVGVFDVKSSEMMRRSRSTPVMIVSLSRGLAPLAVMSVASGQMSWEEAEGISVEVRILRASTELLKLDDLILKVNKFETAKNKKRLQTNNINRNIIIIFSF